MVLNHSKVCQIYEFKKHIVANLFSNLLYFNGLPLFVSVFMGIDIPSFTQSL
jgi:hypothetical protein